MRMSDEGGRLNEEGRKTYKLVEKNQQPHPRLLHTLIRSRNDDLDVPLRLESKADARRRLTDNGKVSLGERGDFVKFSAHLDLDGGGGVEDFGAGDLDDGFALIIGKRGGKREKRERVRRRTKGGRRDGVDGRRARGGGGEMKQREGERVSASVVSGKRGEEKQRRTTHFERTLPQHVPPRRHNLLVPTAQMDVVDRLIQRLISSVSRRYRNRLRVRTPSDDTLLDRRERDNALMLRHRVDANTLHHVAEVDGGTLARRSGTLFAVDVGGSRRRSAAIDNADRVGSAVTSRIVCSSFTGDTRRRPQGYSPVRLRRLMRQPRDGPLPVRRSARRAIFVRSVGRSRRVAVLKGRRGRADARGVELCRDGWRAGEAEGGGVDVHAGGWDAYERVVSR